MKKLKDLPRPILVFIVLFLGAAFFFVVNPPRTICDVQVEVFIKNQAGLIFPKGKKLTSISSLYKRSLGQCELENSVGACLEYFAILRQFAKELSAVQYECLSEVIEVSKIRESLVVGLKTFAKLAWGEEPPGMESSNKFAWFEMSELAIYCDLKNSYIKKYGNEAWGDWIMQVVSELPGANKLQAEEAFMRSIFSLKCESIY